MSHTDHLPCEFILTPTQQKFTPTLLERAAIRLVDLLPLYTIILDTAQVYLYDNTTPDPSRESPGSGYTKL